MKRASILRGAGLVLSGLLLLAGQCRVLAHDPGLSTGQLRALHGQIEVELTLALADVQAMTPLDADNNGQVSSSEWNAAQPSLNRLAGEALSVQTGDQSILSSFASVRRDGSNNVHFTATFPAPHCGAWTFRSDLLSRLPRGHRQFVTVVGANGKVLAEALLSADRPALTVAADAPVSDHAPTFTGFLALG